MMFTQSDIHIKWHYIHIKWHDVHIKLHDVKKQNDAEKWHDMTYGQIHFNAIPSFA